MNKFVFSIILALPLMSLAKVIEESPRNPQVIVPPSGTTAGVPLCDDGTCPTNPAFRFSNTKFDPKAPKVFDQSESLGADAE